MATEFDDSQHWGFFLTGLTLTSDTGKSVRMSELVLAALRAAGVFDNMVDGTSPPTTDKLWLDKNFDPAQLKQWDATGSSWVPMTYGRLFGLAALGTLAVTGGTANAIVVAQPNSTFQANRLYVMTPTANNSAGAVTIQVSGVGTYPVKYGNGSNPLAQEFSNGRQTVLFFDGTKFTVAFSVADLNAAVTAAQQAASDAAGYASAAQTALTSFLASPTFTGDPKAPTPTAGDNDTSIATTAFVTTAIANAGSAKAPLASPTFTGDPKAPTPTAGDNDTSIATTAFVQTALAAAGLSYIGSYPLSSTATAITGLPANIKRLIIEVDNLTLSAAGQPLIQLRTSGGNVATGYDSQGAGIANSGGVGAIAATTGMTLSHASQTGSFKGEVSLQRSASSANLWKMTGIIRASTNNVVAMVFGEVTLSADLTGITITTAAGTVTLSNNVQLWAQL